ncbi:MAG: hypothetical protein U0X87_02250 [Anaerolineales bacterium]
MLPTLQHPIPKIHIGFQNMIRAHAIEDRMRARAVVRVLRHIVARSAEAGSGPEHQSVF